VKECIERGILKDFLENHAGEVINMLMTEWNWEDALAVHREEGWEDGWEKGREDGWEKGQNMVLELMRQGYSAGQIEAKLAAVKPDGIETAGK
jgi:flagellar biosynthesis/type III secretory pathway protein FliH